MRPPRPPKAGKMPPLNPGSLKGGMKGGAKSKLISAKPPKMAPKGY